MRILMAMLGALALLIVAGPSLGTPNPKGFSHNDYMHARPLLDALESGFTHVEADVFLVDGRLLVSHDRAGLTPERNLKDLYLEPLWQLYRANHGRIYPKDKSQFWLMIDIKDKGAEVYETLKTELKPYAPMIAKWTDKGRGKGAVAVVLSGDRPTATVAAEKVRVAAIDGDPEVLDENPPVGLVPWVSGDWGDHFHWTSGPMDVATRDRLAAYVAKAHRQGRLVRFWAIPDTPESWAMQQAEGFDMINTDHLPEFATWWAAHR